MRAKFRDMSIHPLLLKAFVPAIISMAPQGNARLNAMRIQDPERFDKAKQMSKEGIFNIYEAWSLLK